MKIVGYSYCHGTHLFTMKCDASLLQGRKPFFLPDWAEDVRVNTCTVIRICRLGKCIAPKFTDRYYDGVANGLDFTAMDWLDKEYSRATAFDSSLCVGEFATADTLDDEKRQRIADAIANASQIVTLRMGDYLYLSAPHEPQVIQREQVIEKEGLYCKIK